MTISIPMAGSLPISLSERVGLSLLCSHAITKGTNLKFMFFPVDNDSCYLLVHEDKNSHQQSRDGSCKVNPPGISSKWWNEPASVGTGRLRGQRQKHINQSSNMLIILSPQNHIHTATVLNTNMPKLANRRLLRA